MAEGGIARYIFGDAVAVILLPRRGYSRRPTPRRASSRHSPATVTHADGGVADRGPHRTNDRLQVGDQRGAITWTALEPKLAPMT